MLNFEDNLLIKYITNYIINKKSVISNEVLRQKFLSFYKNLDNQEIKDIVSYINLNGINFINYEFVNKYKNFYIKPIRDNLKGLFYIMYKGKRMYFSKDFDTVEKVRQYYRMLCIEQEEASPHCYLNNNFNVNYGDVVVDVGAAEGNFSLEVIDKVKQLYIFEYDDLWIEALKATFEPYKDKVQIIKRYVSNTNNKKSITLDKFFKNREKKIDFIKMDIEGEEPNALKGAVNLLKNNSNMKLAVCVYHNLEDENKVRHILKDISTTKAKIQRRRQNEYSINANGYVVFIYSKKRLKPPYLTRGVLRIQRK